MNGCADNRMFFEEVNANAARGEMVSGEEAAGASSDDDDVEHARGVRRL